MSDLKYCYNCAKKRPCKPVGINKYEGKEYSIYLCQWCRASQTKRNKKPRVRFCWECGKQLRGNHHKEVFYQGYWRVCHKSCADQLTPDAIEDQAQAHGEGRLKRKWQS